MWKVSSWCCGRSLKTGTIVIAVWNLVFYVSCLATACIYMEKYRFLATMSGILETQMQMLKPVISHPSLRDDDSMISHFGTFARSLNITQLLSVVMAILIAQLVLKVLLNIMLLIGTIRETWMLIFVWFVGHATLLCFLPITALAVALIAFCQEVEFPYKQFFLLIIPIVIYIVIALYFGAVVHSYYLELKSTTYIPVERNQRTEEMNMIMYRDPKEEDIADQPTNHYTQSRNGYVPN